MTQYSKISDKIDYNIDKVEDRVGLVMNLVGGYEDGTEGEYDEQLVDFYSKHYNPHINQTGFLSENTKMGKDLESLANYILYSKDSEASDDTVTDYRKKRNNTREANIDKLMKVRDFKRETNKSIFKVPKIKVLKKDREEYKDLAQTGEVIERLSKMIKSGVDSTGKEIHPTELRKLKWIRTDIQKDEVVMKSELKRYISFQSITKSEMDSDALSYLRFDDIEIVRILLEDYVKLKESSYEDTYGYLKIIIFAFEDLVEKTNFSKHMKDIFLWKVEGIAYDEIIQMLNKVHNVKMTKPRLSKITRETIPSMIVDTYKQQREDWVYTFAMKGKYKTCSECKTNHLATTKYFSPDKKATSGLYSVCKECRRKKYKKKTSVKSE